MEKIMHTVMPTQQPPFNQWLPHIRAKMYNDSAIHDYFNECPKCGGHGLVRGEVCDRCEGDGELEHPELSVSEG